MHAIARYDADALRPFIGNDLGATAPMKQKLTRAEIEAMVLGLDRSRPQALVITFPSGRALSARLRA